jgi:hypothetical protein
MRPSIVSGLSHANESYKEFYKSKDVAKRRRCSTDSHKKLKAEICEK